MQKALGALKAENESSGTFHETQWLLLELLRMLQILMDPAVNTSLSEAGKAPPKDRDILIFHHGHFLHPYLQSPMLSTVRKDT